MSLKTTGGCLYRHSNKKMKNKKEWRLAVLLLLGLVLILVINAKLPLEAENRKLAKAVFYVT